MTSGAPSAKGGSVIYRIAAGVYAIAGCFQDDGSAMYRFDIAMTWALLFAADYFDRNPKK